MVLAILNYNTSEVYFPDDARKIELTILRITGNKFVESFFFFLLSCNNIDKQFPWTIDFSVITIPKLL